MDRIDSDLLNLRYTPIPLHLVNEYERLDLVDQPILTQILIEDEKQFCVKHKSCCWACIFCKPFTKIYEIGEKANFVSHRAMNSFYRSQIFNPNDDSGMNWKKGDFTAHITGQFLFQRVADTKTLLNMIKPLNEVI